MITEFVPLRKTPYKESGLILAGLSPDAGKLELVAYQALSGKSGSFPVIDLFRVLQVEYTEPAPGKGGSLATAKEIELVQDFPDLARDLTRFKLAGSIGNFLLRNSAHDSPLPLTYDAYKNVLAHLAANDGWNERECAVVIKLVFLYENGLLPDPEGLTEQAQAKVIAIYEHIIECAVDGEKLPAAGSEYYHKLDDYLNHLIAAAELHWK